MFASYQPAEILADAGVSDSPSHWVDGRSWVPEKPSRVDVEDPATGRVFAAVAAGGPDEVDFAAVAAHAAYHNVWAPMPPARRGALLQLLAGRLLDEQEPIARLESLDTGKPLSQARGDVAVAARYFAYFGEAADKLSGETFWAERADLSYTVREPYGVVAQIIPWNSPITQLARGVGADPQRRSVLLRDHQDSRARVGARPAPRRGHHTCIGPQARSRADRPGSRTAGVGAAAEQGPAADRHRHRRGGADRRWRRAGRG